jgi:hypothetical protein
MEYKLKSIDRALGKGTGYHNEAGCVITLSNFAASIARSQREESLWNLYFFGGSSPNQSQLG